MASALSEDAITAAQPRTSHLPRSSTPNPPGSDPNFDLVQLFQFSRARATDGAFGLTYSNLEAAHTPNEWTAISEPAALTATWAAANPNWLTLKMRPGAATIGADPGMAAVAVGSDSQRF